VTKDRYDRHEAHCAFSSVRREGAKWHVRALCTVEGDKRDLTLKVTGDRLAISCSDGGRDSSTMWLSFQTRDQTAALAWRIKQTKERSGSGVLPQHPWAGGTDGTHPC
jgi:hypothetical protein